MSTKIKKKRNFREANKALVFTVAWCLAYIPLHKPVEKILSATVVKWVLSEIESSWYNDVLFSLATLLALATLLIKFRKYVPSLNLTLLMGAVATLYLSYRIVGRPWHFTGLSLCSWIKYGDILLLVALVNIILYVSRKKHTLRGNNGDSFLDDKPLGKESLDKLGYSAHAKRVADKIRESNFEKSFAIGVNGKWGSGKTSFFDLVKRELPKDGVLEINFNPWNSYTPQAIIKDFFDTVQESVRHYHSSLALLLVKYAEKLVALNENEVTKSFQASAILLSGSGSLNSLFDTINASLKEINLKIVIYIDDMDRLDKEEIIEVIRLIRNTANFYNTFFLVAYDKNYITNALKDHNAYNHKQFLEKIFQIEVTLPQYKRDILMEHLSIKLKEGLNVAYHPKIDEALHSSSIIVPVRLSEWIETMRDVTRLVNSVRLNLNGLIGEVDVSDFIRIEILRLQYPAVYELLYQRKDLFFSRSQNSLKEPRYELARATEKRPALPDEYKNDKYIRGYLKQQADNYGLNDAEIDKITRLLQNLFEDGVPYSYNTKKVLSIVYANKFDRYFAYGLAATNLSETEFLAARDLPAQQFKEKITAWVEKGLAPELQRRFAHIKNFESREDFEKVITGIFHLANCRYTDSRSASLVNYDSYELFDKLTDYDDRLTRRFYGDAGGKEGLRNFIKSFLEKAKSPYEFEGDFITAATRAMLDPKMFVLTKEELKAYAVGYLRAFCEATNKFDDTVYGLYWHTEQTDFTEVSSGVSQSQRVIPQETKDVFKKYILKDLDTFLFQLITVEMINEKSFAVSTFADNLFNGLPSFKEFIMVQDETKWKNLREFKAFLLELEKKDFSQYVPFNFSVMPVETKKRGQ